MPVLAWRNDADGFAFANSWTFDAAERATLNALADPIIPAMLSTLAPLFPLPDPFFWAGLAAAAKTYITLGPLPGYGLCGGMAYTALDHWRVRVPIPRGANNGDQPSHAVPVQAAIRTLLWKRLIDSLTVGGVLEKTLEWSLLLNQIPRELGGGAEALKNRTLEEWTQLRAHIDAGQPWPIALVCTTRDVWNQHQILVYGYENTGDNQGKLFIYENNSPSQFGDASPRELALDFRGPTLIAEAPSGAGMLAGFFCSNYQQAPPIDEARHYGEFLSWTADPRTWMVTDGVRMPLASGAELSALGGTAQDVRATASGFIPTTIRPRDGALLRERSSS